MRRVGWIGCGHGAAIARHRPDGVPGFVVVPHDNVAVAIADGVEAILLEVGADDGDATGTIIAAARAASPVPLIVVTMQAAAAFEIAALRAGADVCAVLPIPPDLLAARLEALLRRGAGIDTILTCGDLRIDLLTRTVSRNDETIDLRPREYALLLYLARRGGAPVSTRKLLRDVWHLPNDPGTNVVQAHMSRLRAKIDARSGPSLIRWSRGVGYSLGGIASR